MAYTLIATIVLTWIAACVLAMWQQRKRSDDDGC